LSLFTILSIKLESTPVKYFLLCSLSAIKAAAYQSGAPAQNIGLG